MKQNIYRGHKDGLVTVNDRPLNIRHDVHCHSFEFSWGYAGSGPSQLALAIMLNEFGDDFDEHPLHYMVLKDEVIARFPSEAPFVLTSDTINELVSMKRAHSNTRMH